MRFRSTCTWGLICCSAALANPAAHADTFLLKTGGQVQGEWLNRNETTSAGYVVRTPSGVKLTLTADAVVERILERPAEREYEQLAPTFADTVVDQWRLAQWCRRQQLNRQRKTHLARIIELDPNHADARAALGYSQVNGKWSLREDWRKEQGYTYYKGRWRLSQETAMLQRREAQHQIERDWYTLIRRQRESLSPETAAQFRHQILQIRDPNAVPGITSLLIKEPQRAVKFLYIEALRNIDTPAAALALVVVSLNDPDVEIFHEAIAQLAEIKHPEAVDAYMQGLKNDNNVRVNRSGAALGKLAGPQAIEPLIESLVTTHILVYRPPSDGSADGVTTVFTNGPNNGICQSPPKNFAGMTAGDQTKIIPRRVPNPEVLAALVKQSGGLNFGYDQQAWRNWRESERKRQAAAIDLRQ